MSKKARKLDEEPPISDLPGSDLAGSPKTQYSGIKDDITEADLEDNKVAKVVARTLLGRMKECQKEISELKGFKDKYHEKNQESAVLQERMYGLEESVSVRSLLFTLGGIFGGLAFLPDIKPYLWGFIILCFVCLIMALWNPKFLRKDKNIK